MEDKTKKHYENELEDYFYNNTGNHITKWTHYFSIYDRYFKKYKGKPIVFLEIGVFQGGSLQMWKSYFGDKAQIYGIDIDPRCKDFEAENISIFIGSQNDRKFLKGIKAQIPKADIILDDGGHFMRGQRISFEELFDHVKEDGIYMVEDCHTSYWPGWGGGYLRKGTFIEYSKKIIDKMHAWYTKRIPVDKYTKGLFSVAFYDSIVVFEKAKKEEPKQIMSGNVMPKFQSDPPRPFKVKLLSRIVKYAEPVLALLRIRSWQ